MKVQHIAIEGKCFFINTDMIIRRSSYLLICRSIISYLNFQDLCAEEEAALLIHMGII